MDFKMKLGDREIDTPGTFRKEQEDKIKEIQLDNVTVSVLSKESYAKLNQAQKQVYDYMTSLEGPKGNKGIKPMDATIYNRTTKERRVIDPFSAIKMLSDTGVKKISNKPSMFGPKPSPEQKSRKWFRPHSNVFTSTLHVAKPTNKKNVGGYMQDVFAEAAHIADPKKHSMKSIYEATVGGFNSKKQKASYGKKGTMEHRTHRIVEPELINKYSKPKK